MIRPAFGPKLYLTDRSYPGRMAPTMDDERVGRDMMCGIPANSQITVETTMRLTTEVRWETQRRTASVL